MVAHHHIGPLINGQPSQVGLHKIGPFAEVVNPAKVDDNPVHFVPQGLNIGHDLGHILGVKPSSILEGCGRLKVFNLLSYLRVFSRPSLLEQGRIMGRIVAPHGIAEVGNTFAVDI